MASWTDAAREVILTLLGISLLQVSLFVQIFAVGLATTWSDATRSFRHPWILARSLSVTNVAIPLTAIILIKSFSLEAAVGITLAVLSASPVLALPRLRIAKDEANEYTFQLISSQAILALVAVPATVSLVNWLTAVKTPVDELAIAMYVGETILLPLTLGLLTSFLLPTLRRVVPVFLMIGLLSLAAATIPLLPIASVDRGTLAALSVFVAAGIIGREWINRFSKEHGMPSATAIMRHPGPALSIAALNFPFASKLVCGAILTYVIAEVIVSVIHLVRRQPALNHPRDTQAAKAAAS